jgi:dGTP triphosphohydrolase
MDETQREYLMQLQRLTYGLYPYPDLYMSELEGERDLQYLMQMYPKDAKQIQKKVEKACDKLEYEGSMLYDEYPDRVSMLLICDQIAGEMMAEEAGDGPVQPMEPARRSLLEVLLYNEMHKRRCERRGNRRFW